MQPISASQLLQVWEQGIRQSTVQRALLLLAAACPETPADALTVLSIGQRDARLLTLREWTFGPQLVSLATCPACNERLELSFTVADIQVEAPTETSEPPSPAAWSVNGYDVCFRLPNSLDLVFLVGQGTNANTRNLLLERCLLSVEHDGRETAVSELPPAIIHAIAKQMVQADPQADVQLALTCAVCGHSWQALFDIVSYFWAEIDAWAYRTLADIHWLASAYGWRESDSLAVSPWRRQLYLDMISQ